MNELADLARWECEMFRYGNAAVLALTDALTNPDSAYASTVAGLVEAVEAFAAFPALDWWVQR